MVNMQTIADYIVARMQERSTWIGLTTAASALGVALSPEQAQAIITLGVGIAGVIAAVTADVKRGTTTDITTNITTTRGSGGPTSTTTSTSTMPLSNRNGAIALMALAGLGLTACSTDQVTHAEQAVCIIDGTAVPLAVTVAPLIAAPVKNSISMSYVVQLVLQK